MADYSVRLNSTGNYTVSQEKTVVAEFLSDLADVSVPNLPTKDQYVLTYDANLQKYVLVPADQVLQTSAEDATLPPEFVQQLEVDLDNQIDVDGGEF
jgi:hypothetical protein